MQGIENTFRLTKSVWLTAVILASMLLVQIPFAEAQEEAANHGWEFQVAPYLWAISMKGNVTVKGLEADADVGFKDILDELNLPGTVVYEAQKGTRIPIHKHPQEQCGYLVSGKTRLTINDQVYNCNPGDSWCIPGNAKHANFAISDSVVIEIFSPVREDLHPETEYAPFIQSWNR